MGGVGRITGRFAMHRVSRIETVSFDEVSIRKGDESTYVPSIDLVV